MKELFIYLIKSSIVLTVFYLIYILLLKKDTLFILKRYFLLVGLIVSFILPYIQYTKRINKYKEIAPTFIAENNRDLAPVAVMPEHNSSNIITNFETTNAFVNQVSEHKNTDVQLVPQQTVNPWIALGVLYFLGILTHTILFTLNIFSLKKLLKNIPIKRYKNFTVATSNKRIPPFTFFKKVVINPSLYTSQEIKYILRHEIAHATQYHSIDLMVLKVTQMVLWFHPIIPLYKKSIELNLECIADQEALKTTKNSRDYQLTLLKFQNFNPAPLTLHFYKSLLKNRVIMMNKARTNRLLSLKSLFILPILGVFFYSFNVKEEIIWNEIKASTPTHNPIIKLKTFEPDSTQIKNVSDETEAVLPHKKEKTQDTQKTPLNVQTTKVIVPTTPLENQNTFIHFEFENTDNKSTIEDKIKDIEKKHSLKLTLDQLEYNDDGYISKINISFEDDLGNTGSLSDTESEKPIANLLLIKELDALGKTKNLKFFSGSYETLLHTLERNKLTSRMLSLGKKPLFILDGVEYKNDELAGKSFFSTQKPKILLPKESRQLYGKKAEDGVVILSNPEDSIKDIKAFFNRHKDNQKNKPNNDKISVIYGVEISGTNAPFLTYAQTENAPEIKLKNLYHFFEKNNLPHFSSIQEDSLKILYNGNEITLDELKNKNPRLFDRGIYIPPNESNDNGVIKITTTTNHQTND